MREQQAVQKNFSLYFQSKVLYFVEMTKIYQISKSLLSDKY